MTLDLRFMRALHHWQGRTDVSLTKIILDLVAAATRARERARFDAPA